MEDPGLQQRLLELFHDTKARPMNARKRLIRPYTSRRCLAQKVKEVDEVAATIAHKVTDLFHLNCLQYAAAALTIEISGTNSCPNPRRSSHH